jgi:L-ascorbate metabolism protein UlaG (beta-lactamase superfamily)
MIGKLSLGTILLVALAEASFSEAPMPLSKIARRLAAPPRLEESSSREEVYGALDAWADRPDVVYWDGDPQKMNREFLAYYLGCVRRALREARETHVEHGAVIWKLYSSGFLVRTPETVFALDVVEGPYKDIHASPEDDPGFLFKWTPEMRREFAELVEVLFITHWHYDHASFALAEALLAANKTVVVPPQLKEAWRKSALAPKLTTLMPNTDHQLGSLLIRVFEGVQYMKLDESGTWVSLGGNLDTQNNVYLIRTKQGKTFLHHGDNRGMSFAPWLREAAAKGWQVDVWFTPLEWPGTMFEEVEKIVRPVIVPCHEHELGHKPVHGMRHLAFFCREPFRQRLREGRLLILTWGEKFHFK